MTNTTKAKLPDIELASKDWVLKEMIDTEKRIEKAFHDQTQYLTQQHREQHSKIDTLKNDIAVQNRWTIGIIISIGIAIVAAILQTA